MLKTPKTESSVRKVYIPSSVALLLAELREEQNETIKWSDIGGLNDQIREIREV